MSPDPTIEIADYDPRGPARYRGERDRVRLGLATASLRYEHVGSTAVPQMEGRPVVDLLLGAPPAAWAALAELRARLVALGYQDLGEPGGPGRLVFSRRTLRAFDISLVELDGPVWRGALALRDVLRASPEEAAAYAAANRAGSKAAAMAALIDRARATAP